MQGSFIQTMFSEDKIKAGHNKSIEGHISSFGMHKADGIVERKAEHIAENAFLGELG